MMTSLCGWMIDVCADVIVVGCPDFDPPPDAWVERTATNAVIRCNFTQETWYMSCDHNTWSGVVTNCSQRE